MYVYVHADCVYKGRVVGVLAFNLLCHPCRILLGLRDVCVDWLNGEPRDDPATRGDKDPKGGIKVDVPCKAVRPSSTQVSSYCAYLDHPVPVIYVNRLSNST